MCGIYGSTFRYSEETLRAKLKIVSFRGPDFTSLEYTEDIILGHNRLKVLDLDARSNQPFTYGPLKIVFNGEIYNYRDIKAKLLKKGYSFTTTSDTEVICAAYLEYGKHCLQLFNGMFAFIIYDSSQKQLFGARDRFGKKPFYYYHANGHFEFASQPSQISIGNSFTMSHKAINAYLNYSYIPDPMSIWEEVQKLPAAHSLTYNLNSDSLSIEPYWDIDYSWQNKFTGSYEEAKSNLKELLADAVQIRMMADVPVGVFLSGGVDSSLITALASQKNNSVKTFSIRFNEKGFDEGVYSSQVARCLATDHYAIECNYNEGIDLIRNFSTYYDEPFADSSAIPSLLLAKYTRKHVVVALSGDAGDEGYLGYERYNWMKISQMLFRLPLSLRKLFSSLISLSPNYRHKLIARGITLRDLETLYVQMMRGMENSWTVLPDNGLKSPHIQALINSSKPLLERISDFEIKTYLNGDINTKVDRASMAFSLESRAPLMDYRVIEFGRSLPTGFKFGQGIQKRILRDILYEYVPAEIFNRPKAGFTMPFEKWFRNELKDYVLDHLSLTELKNIPGINIDRTQEIINEHMTGTWNRHSQIWKLLVLSQWIKNQKPKSVYSVTN